VWLYSVVYAGKISIAAITLLFLSFLIQPFHQALANEAAEPEVTETQLPAEVEEQLPDPEPESEVEPSENIESEIVESNPETEESSAPEENLAEEPVEDSSDTSENVEQTEENLEGEVDSADEVSSTTVAVVPEEDVSETTSASSTDNEVVDESASSTDEVVDLDDGQQTDETASTTATSTDEIVDGENDNATTSEDVADDSDSGGGSDNPTNNEGDDVDEESNSDQSAGSDEDQVSDEEDPGGDLIDDEAIEDGVNNLVDEVVSEVVTLTRQLVTEENYYQFSRQSCAPVGDGTFHCTMKDSVEVDPDSAVYAEQDKDGDMEIYMRTSKGDIKQLTDNAFDDTSPDLDLATMRVVWQRMIDGRYQIISYDLKEREETQLTFSRTNSMEPKVAKEGIVWQAWDGNDWEVLYFDGKFTDQITDNNLQDVTPVVEDGYVLWSVLGGEESEARVYSIETGEVMTISGYEGGAVANPRFVLVYDTKFDNGDIVTQGFDPDTGLAQPIAAQPAELPFDIPEADPVGEIRALIQNKSTNDKKEIVTVSTSTDSGELDLATSTVTNTDTLVLELEEAEATDQVVGDDFELTEFDLIITETASSAPAVLNPPLINVPAATDTEFIATSTQ
tara:strand:- start:13677 stop:15542 length:1866 start_codon:yes stop_codon:yes gene_type:complete